MIDFTVSELEDDYAQGEYGLGDKKFELFPDEENGGITVKLYDPDVVEVWETTVRSQPRYHGGWNTPHSQSLSMSSREASIPEDENSVEFGAFVEYALREQNREEENSSETEGHQF